jgi:hypothetical protein
VFFELKASLVLPTRLVGHSFKVYLAFRTHRQRRVALQEHLVRRVSFPVAVPLNFLFDFVPQAIPIERQQADVVYAVLGHQPAQNFP